MATRPPSKFNNKKNEVVSLEHGKMPPQALELEEAVLGAVMLEKDAVIAVLDILAPESFYKDSHQKIFAAIVSLSTNERPIDILTVTEELKKERQLEEVGGPYYIAQLTNRVASSANIEFHARIIQQKYIQRELIRITSDIQTKAFDDAIDVNDLLDYSEGQLFEIASGNIKKDLVRIGMIIGDAIKQIEEAGKNEDNLSGVPTGFTRLDRLTSGWQRSDLIVIAARPAMGKTAFVLSMTRNMAVDHKRPVAVFSLEMASIQLVNRLISAESEIPAERIRSGKLSHDEWKQLDARIKPLETAPIFIDDTPGISIFELRAKCRRLKKQHDVQVIIIDYLQLMTGPPETRGNREQEVSVISRSLKSLAKELNVPVLALSQLNRSVEMRTGNKRPQLSDLRESGAIEQDADIVCFIHRPEKYGILEDEDGNSTAGMAEIIIAKHRNGAIGDVKLRFRDVVARFVDYDDLAPLDDNMEIKPVITMGSKMNAEKDFDFNASSGFAPNKGFGDEEAPF
jgi:replicative DNA helicase